MMFPEIFVELWLFLILVEDRSGVTVVGRSLFCLGGLDLEEFATDCRSGSARFCLMKQKFSTAFLIFLPHGRQTRSERSGHFTTLLKSKKTACICEDRAFALFVFQTA